MLHVIDNYYAQNNNFGYTVLRDTGRKDKDKNKIYTTLGYVGSLKEVLEVVLRDVTHSKISGCEIELKDVLQFVKEQTDRILKAMVGIEV